MMELNRTYNRDNFLHFLNENFLPDFKKDVRPASAQGHSSIQKAYSLGRSERLDLQVFEFSFEGSPNKRVALTKDAFQIMRSHAIFQALAIFHSPGSDDWRLSLMTATPERTEKGKVAITYSNPKRLSFFLGPNAKVNTPTKFILKRGTISDFDDLRSRFSIEVVNKEFYKEISGLFTRLVGGSIQNGKKMENYEALLKLPSIQEKSQTSLEFAVRLIGRVIFCWFLREKKSGQDKSLMPTDLLSLGAVKKTPDYYHSILEPIFFEVLNKPVRSRRDGYDKEPFSSIPYLNGGLFSPHDDDFFSYNRVKQAINHNTVVIPDEWIRKFFEILETYNFTIDENTSFDEELSIDPEMLGRIFENLLAEINPETGESARKSTGSYYTPRVIVDYMVDESLLLYLQNQTHIDEDKLRAVLSYDLNDDEENTLTENERERIITALEKVKILDPACGSGAFPIGALQKIVFILQQADPIGQLWFKKQIKNTSPELRRVVEREFAHKNFDYIRKLGIIRENIYGVDIQPIATEIARLRCFLTLVVDERIQEDLENRGIEPLPNLDFKFVTANSLVGLPGSQVNSQIGLFEDDAGIRELKELRDMFFNASGAERDQLTLQFVQAQNRMFQRLISDGRKGHADLTTKLTTWDPFSHKSSSWFDPEWMFGIKDGFDIVIANPPYVGEKGHKEVFKDIKSSILGTHYQGKMDLFYFFFHFGLNLVKENGQITFISTNYYPTALGARKLRKELKKAANIRKLLNFNELKIFESATGQHNMITILSKGYDDNVVAENYITKRTGIASTAIIQNIIDGIDEETNYYKVAQKELYEGEECYIRLTGNSEVSVNPLDGILSKVKKQGVLLGSICVVNTGIMGGCDFINKKNIHYSNKLEIELKDIRLGDGVFVLDEKNERDALVIKNIITSNYLKRFFKNSDIGKYYTNDKTTKFIIFSSSNNRSLSNKYIKDHLDKFRSILEKVRSINNEKINSYPFLRRGTAHQEIFESPKIVAPQRSPNNTFGYNEIPWYGSADIYFITENDKSISLKYILALLNSKVYYVWLYYRGKRKGETLELYQKPLSEIPIKKISTEGQRPFIEIVDKILELAKTEDYLQNHTKQAQVKEYEKQIDQVVYKLYGLTEEEIKTVEEQTGTKTVIAPILETAPSKMPTK